MAPVITSINVPNVSQADAEKVSVTCFKKIPDRRKRNNY